VVSVTASMGRARHATSRPWLAALMALSLGLVVAVGLWDQSREAEASLVDVEHRQAALATLVASVVTARLEVVRADALAAAAGDRALSGRWRYDALSVVSALVPPSATTGEGITIAVPVSGERRVDASLQAAQLVADLSAGDGEWVALRPPGARSFFTASGQQFDGGLVFSIARRGASTRLSRVQAAALGLPRRAAVAGAATIDGGALGRWSVVVAMSVASERDRQLRAKWRILFGVVLAGGLVLAFGWYAARAERKELGLLYELTVAELEQRGDGQIEREGRAATMLTFAAGVAHEIATPLSVIQGRAEQLLARAADDPRAANAAQRILDQTARIDGVIRGFLRLARGAEPALERVDAAEVARAASALVRHRYAKAGVSLRVEAADDGAAIRGDRRLLEHALVNLLLNACDACARGGAVLLRVRRDAASVSLEVDDDGVGVGPDLVARVTEPFFSTKPADRPRPGDRDRDREDPPGRALPHAAPTPRHSRGDLHPRRAGVGDLRGCGTGDAEGFSADPLRSSAPPDSCRRAEARGNAGVDEDPPKVRTRTYFVVAPIAARDREESACGLRGEAHRFQRCRGLQPVGTSRAAPKGEADLRKSPRHHRFHSL
jgi:two-component system NtrC family sensor kinase